MNQELVKALKSEMENSGSFKFVNIANDIKIFKKSHAKYNHISFSTLKILIVCLKFKENEQLANEILIKMIPEAEIEELIMIFTKITVYNDKFIEYCKRYAEVRQVRPIIIKIFKKLKITYEPAHIYNIDDFNNSKNEAILKSLLNTFNTDEFKTTKVYLQNLKIEKIKEHLPVLNEIGIRNFRKIFQSEFSSFFKLSPFDKSEIIRVEYY